MQGDKEPVSMSDALGNAADPPTFEWRGKAYNLGRLCPKVIARFEQLILAAETESVRALRAVLTAGEYADAVSRLGRQVRTRAFGTGGELWTKYAAGEEAQTGFRLHVLALIREHHSEVTEDDVRAMLDEDADFVLMAADEAAPDFFAHVAAVLKLAPATMTPLIDRMRAAVRAGLSPTP